MPDSSSAFAFQLPLGADQVNVANHVYTPLQTLDAQFLKGSDLASGATITLPAATAGSYFDITGAVTITAISTRTAGQRVIFQFDGAPQLTHNVTSFILPGGISHTVAAGAHWMFLSLGSGNWAGFPMTSFDTAQLASGTLGVARGGTGAATFTDAGVMLGNGTGALQVTSAGTSGQVLTSNGAGVDPTFQAAAGGAGTPRVLLTWPSIGSTLAVSTSNDCVFQPLFIPGNMTITQLGFYVGTASGNMSIAIYNAAGTRLGTTGAISTPAAGANWPDITSLALTAGQHWIGLSSDNTTTTFATMSGATDFSSATLVVVGSAHPAPASFTPPTIPGSVTGRGMYCVGVAL